MLFRSGRDLVGPVTLMRLRAAARLHRETGLPVLVSGGAPDGPGESEARLMARSLKEDFGITARWLEEQSTNTAGNAILSAPLLHEANVRRILLVTDAVHMPRARWAFERVGLESCLRRRVFSRPDALMQPASFHRRSLSGRVTMRCMNGWGYSGIGSALARRPEKGGPRCCIGQRHRINSVFSFVTD